MSKPSDIFDRKFVYAAIFIGLGYAIVMVGLSKAVGPAAAGVAGVALTSLATALFKQFENLRFRQLAADEGVLVVVPRLKMWVIIALAFAGFVMSGLLQVLLVIAICLWWMSRAEVTENNVVEVMARFGAELGQLTNESLALNTLMSGVTCIGYALFGMLCAFVWRGRLAHSYALFGALTSQIIPLLCIGAINLLFLLAKKPFIAAYSLRDGMYSAAYVVAAFMGCYLTSKRQKPARVNSSASSQNSTA